MDTYESYNQQEEKPADQQSSTTYQVNGKFVSAQAAMDYANSQLGNNSTAAQSTSSSTSTSAGTGQTNSVPTAQDIVKTTEPTPEAKLDGGGDHGGKKKTSQNDEDNLRGGKQKDRDRDLKQYPKEFQKWYHREYKPNVNPGVDATPGELRDIHQEWEDLGKPVVKATALAVAGIAIWEGVKWIGAAVLAPETGGASLVIASALP
jgi:hypothetical protein